MSEPKDSLVANAADEDQVKKAKNKEKFSRERELEDMKSVLESPMGRRIFWKYLSDCGVFKTSFNESSHTMAFLEGQRNVGLKILTDITQADPTKYLQMMEEAKEGKM